MTCIGPGAELRSRPVPGDLPQLRRVRIDRVGSSHGGVCAPPELEEVPMPIVGGLDIHRKQITFDYLDTGPGRCSAARSARPTGSTCGPGWRGSLAARTSRSRSRGVPGGGTSRRSWPRPGSRCIWPSRPIPRSPAAASGTPRPIRPTAGTCGCCWPRDGCRSAGSRPATSWKAGRCWSCITICGPSTPPGCSGSTRCLFHQGAPALGEGTLRTGPGLAALRDVSAAHLSPAGQLQVATALEVLEALEARLHAVRHQLLQEARHLAGAKVLAARLYGVGPFAALAMTCWLGGAGRFSSSRQAVRFAGLDVTVWSSDRKGPPGRLSRQGPPVLRWAVYEAGKTHARASAPDHAYYAQVKDRCGGKRAALSEARKILRQACHILAELGDDALAAA